MKVSKDHVVLFDYEVRNSRSELLDSSTHGGNPMAYIHGSASIIPGLEKAFDGRTAGEQFAITVPPVEAYGMRDERRIGQVDRSIFPTGADIKPGMRFQATSAHGTDNVVVVSVEGDTITVDANHPLAGETLTFNVTIRDVRPASAEEIAHGHVHHAHECSCGGHDHHHGHAHGDGECCGGHGHADAGDDHECCGGHGGDDCSCR